MSCLCLGLKFDDQILSKQNKLRCNSATRMEKKKEKRKQLQDKASGLEAMYADVLSSWS